MAFGYFEVLIKHGSVQKCSAERERLQSLATIVSDAGFDLAMFEDFAEETLEVLDKVSNALHNVDASEIIHTWFNDEIVQNYMITHLRVSLYRLVVDCDVLSDR